MIMKTDSRQGLVQDILVGIVGAFIGGFVLDFFNIPGGQVISGININSFGTALLGAVILIAIGKAIR
ncbi:MAG: GlsB/YeaQ/YmgE family stress response membrane protein [Chloroflexota bacterium]